MNVLKTNIAVVEAKITASMILTFDAKLFSLLLCIHVGTHHHDQFQGVSLGYRSAFNSGRQLLGTRELDHDGLSEPLVSLGPVLGDR